MVEFEDNNEFSDEFNGSEEFNDDNEVIDDSEVDETLIELPAEDYIEEDISDEEYIDEEEEEFEEGDEGHHRGLTRARTNRYQKYKNVVCPHCKRTFNADKIRFTHARSVIIYSCPRCKTILSINNKQRRLWRQNRPRPESNNE